MGGVAKKAMSFTPVGIGANYLQKKGDSAQSDWQSQYDAMNSKRPDAITRKSRLDSKGELMADVYKLKGPEEWQKAALAKQGLEEAQLNDKGMHQAAGAAANARSALASKGGLTGGSAERLAKSQMNDQISMGQSAARQGLANRADIGLESENKRSAAEKYNIEQALGERNAEDAFNQQKYQTDMQEWAAAKQGQATFGAGKGKGQSGGIMGGVSKVIGK